jgi:RND family efflux transporter MFP subunit
LFTLGALDRFQASGKETPEQIKLTTANIQQSVDSLRNLGMSDIQIEEIARTRQLTQNIVVASPAAGFILARNVSPGQRFEKATEFYRIADLSHVWILADLFENEARFIRAGQRATVRYEGRSLQAKTSDVLPQFDAATRTLKVRFELENSGYTLRPDMFVDVEFPISLPPAVTVPADAVIDSGLKRTVFLARGNGYFEPRMVETGWRLGDRVQITNGLEPGERIVVSGNFLLDSETRMKSVAAAAMAAAHKDPRLRHGR